MGIVANPASGRDIRRLVAGASVFGNADKAGMVFRLLAGLGAAGVERVLMMPAADGLSTTLHRQLHAPHGAASTARRAVAGARGARRCALDGTARDSTARGRADAAPRASRAIVVLGGDGTHRVVAKACGDVPICALSTGTNNAFPEMRETTVAGLATGLVATGRGGRRRAAPRGRAGGRRAGARARPRARRRRREPRALHRRAGAVARRRRQRALRDLRRTRARSGCRPSRARSCPLPRGSGRGLHVRLAPTRRRPRPSSHVAARPGPRRPGRRSPSTACSTLGEPVEVAPGPGTVALDGEREIERRARRAGDRPARRRGR